ncbi:DUF3298 and DUF4163 domain-containing protein [Chlorobium sp. BLA1]|uniref:DUF3298 and DUF4163 domain-containing protein n=1 Tax=Candidatus Chlorobium masyuteum TaxID=2716876 RepID=UPI00141F0944|nr:DUF3298 and DUF4163 domain-containing protein [Candidatus Chlorobium masyuteum]NHQ60742.1 DUF3298 and DUF4163 domain-containing protein [Candidatus Chlorobium masyuteum]
MKSFRYATFAVAASLFMTTLIFSPASCVERSGGKRELPLDYSMKRVEKSYSNRNSPEKYPTYCRASYPHFSGGANADSINLKVHSYIADSTGLRLDEAKGGAHSIEALSEAFLRGYEAFRIERASGEIPWQFDLNGAVLLNRSGILTLDITFYSFTGGAHGMSHTEYLVFDTNSGRRMGLADVFLPGYEVRLNELVDGRFRQLKGLSKTDPLDGEEGGLVENVIRFNKNFAVTDKGVLFLYNVYEIAPYVNGSTELSLTWRDLKPLLQPRFRNF